jgi:hypothetical protein
VEELAEAQRRTEERVGRLEVVVGELAEAQKRTEHRMEELAEAQKETQRALQSLGRSLEVQLGALGARWGLQSEEAFRQGIRTILEDFGLRTERFLQRDEEGEVFGSPDQIELDVVVTNGEVLVVEIKSSVNKGDVHWFRRKVAFFERVTGRKVDRKLIVTPYADPFARQTALRFGIELCTDLEALAETTAKT